MLVTGIILAPVALATPALQDLVDLRSVINAAANTIGDQNNPNKGWGISFLGGNNQMGTADLINNVTMTILRSKFQLDTNRTQWLQAVPALNGTSPNGTAQPWTPTLPLTSSLSLPSIVPTTTPTLDNVTTDLSTPYIDFVSAIPNLSTSLTSLGRAYHREMNGPVYQAIAGLQQSISALQSSMLGSNLIRPNAVVRTLRASSSLEDAQQAWSRWLNLPGSVSGPIRDPSGAFNDDTDSTSSPPILRREAIPLKTLPTDGGHYTHKELWGARKREMKHFHAEQQEWSSAATMWRRFVA
ncbi:hypothetical protein ACN47E_003904 [Coniothyrium glycines]